MVSKRLSNLTESVAAATLKFLRDLQMQYGARLAQKAVVEGVSDQRVLELKTASTFLMNKIERAHWGK